MLLSTAVSREAVRKSPWTPFHRFHDTAEEIGLKVLRIADYGPGTPTSECVYNASGNGSDEDGLSSSMERV